MNLHGLESWSLRLNSRKRVIGLCSYARMTLELSVHLIDTNEWQMVEQVILHEIAHALTEGHAHDEVWRETARAIGVKNPRSRCDLPVQINGRYQATCDTCGKTYHRHRKSMRMGQTACPLCCNNFNAGKYTSRYALTWVDTLPEKSRVEPTTNNRGADMSEDGTYSAPALAQKIGTDAKTLRRFLRENASFRNPGSGGRYVFTAKEAESVEKAFRSWDGKRSRRSQTSDNTRAKGKTQSRSAERQKSAQKRVDALEAALLASGKHISQHQ